MVVVRAGVVEVLRDDDNVVVDVNDDQGLRGRNAGDRNRPEPNKAVTFCLNHKRLATATFLLCEGKFVRQQGVSKSL